MTPIHRSFARRCARTCALSLISRRAATLLISLSLSAGAHAASAAPPSLFDYERRPITVVRDSIGETLDGVRETVLLLSDGARDTIVARLYAQTAHSRRRPALIMGHGAPGSGARLSPRARYFARRGAVVLVVDAPFVRRDETDPITITEQDSVELVQQVISYRRAFDWLAARDDIDASRIGFVGGSHSAYVGALFAGAEPRLAAVALAMGDVSYVEHFRNEDGRWNKYFPSSLPSAQIDRWVASLRPFDGAEWLARSRVRHVLLQNALNDEAVPQHAAIKLHAAAPPGALHEWYDSGHRMPPEAFFAQLQFFSRTLGLAPPVLSDESGPYATRAPAPPASERPS